MISSFHDPDRVQDTCILGVEHCVVKDFLQWVVAAEMRLLQSGLLPTVCIWNAIVPAFPYILIKINSQVLKYINRFPAPCRESKNVDVQTG